MFKDCFNPKTVVSDFVADYGDDGTQHEIAIGISRAKAIVGVLSGGTGNGFANELGTQKAAAVAGITVHRPQAAPRGLCA